MGRPKKYKATFKTARLNYLAATLSTERSETKTTRNETKDYETRAQLLASFSTWLPSSSSLFASFRLFFQKSELLKKEKNSRRDGIPGALHKHTLTGFLPDERGHELCL